MKGAPKQVENVGCGSVTPFSVPATFEVIYGYARGAPTGRPVRQEAGEVATFPVDSLRGSRRR